MAAKNHPFFFPLLKKLIIVSINQCNIEKITKEDKEKIQQLSGVSWGYLDKIITKEIYTSNSGQSSVGKPTLNKLIRCLPSEWGYGENWQSFRKKVLKELVDKELINDLPDKDYDDIFDKNIQKRIKKEVKHIAQRYLKPLYNNSLEKSSINLNNNIEINSTTDDIKKPSDKTYLSFHFFTILSIGLIGLSILVVTIFKYIISTPITNLQMDRAAIINTIKNGINAEFTTYKGIPQDTNYIEKLTPFFGENQIGRITKTADRCNKRNWTLNNEKNYSKALCIDVKIDTIIDNNIAYVSTFEHWSLNWYDLKEKDYKYKYNVPNKQRYVLHKDSMNRWLIIDNDYSGNPPKSLPQNYTCDDFIELINIPLRQFEFNVNNSLFIDIEKSITLIRCYLEKNDLKGSDEYLSIIQTANSYRKAQEYLNLEKATEKPFKEVENETIAKVYNILRSITASLSM